MIGRIEHAYHRRIEEVLAGGSLTGAADGELLERFATGSPGESEVAFAMLVERHGPMVLRVCRGVLRDPHDAEDAFQATFLVLVRRARSIRKAGSLGPWLHGVALRVSACQRSARASRRARERRWAGDRPEADEPAEAERRDALRAIQEEVGRLPDRYRSAIVLCDLEALPLDAAASRLGWPPGTVKSRLHRGRRQLRDRLIRRGLAPAAVGSALGTIAESADAAMTAELAEQTLLGALAASTRAAQVGAAARVAELAARAGRALFMDRLKAASMGLAALLAFGAGAAAMAGWLPGQEGRRPAAAEAPAQAPPGPATAKAAARPAPRSPLREGRRTIPLTIAGRAADEAGRPVAGAEIIITNANRSRTATEPDLLATGKSDAEGRFAIRDVPLPVLTPPPGPLPSAEEGRFQVAGTAPGFGFTWHRVRGFRPGPRPAAAEKGDLTASTAIHEGEPIRIDLTFGPPASLRGRIADDAGRPLADVPIQVGYIDEAMRPGGSGTWRCDRVDATGGAVPQDLRSFNGIGHLPASLRSARTGPDGTYRIDGLPREAELLASIDPGPEFEPFVGTIATTSRPIEGILSLGHDATLDRAFAAPAECRFHVTRASTGRPARGATVRAETDATMLRGGSVGEADDRGEAVLHLRPGEYRFVVVPRPGELDLPARGSIRVRRGAQEPSIVILPSAAAVVVRAVDAATGDGVEGVSFDYEAETSRERKELRSRPGAMDHPTTGPDGRLRAVLEPGRYRLAAAEIPRGWKLGANPAGQAGSAASRFLALAPGAEAEVRFQVERAEAPGAEAARDGEPGAVPKAIADRWESQRRLSRRGAARIRRYYFPGGDIPGRDLEAFLDATDLARVADPVAAIRARFPALEAPGEVTYEILDDGRRRRNDYGFGPEKGLPQVTISNGREVLSGGSNAQVDIFDVAKGGRAVLGIEDLVHWPVPSRSPGARPAAGHGVPDGQGADDGRLTILRDGRRLVVDARTGFVHVDSWGDRRGGAGRSIRQYGPRTLAGGAIVPRVGVEFDIRGDVVSSCWLTLIDDIDLSREPGPLDFTMPAPAGMLIIDHREDAQNPRMGTCHYPVSDVLAYAERFTSRSQFLEKVLKPGDDAPEIQAASWLTRDGKTVPPALRGKVVLIDFWGISCGPCIGQLPEVQAAADHFADRPDDLLVIGVHESGVAEGEVAEFARKRGLSFTMALDRPAAEAGWFGATFKDYGLRAIPAAAVLDRRGKVAYVGRFAEALAKAAELINGP
ncbi:ECF RNA polymerase sigma factor SigE [Aquisphaera giovannonii]|uniref:ECF RNA polymerase sigma factor SigE n=1 Tax=Aquisphaera giovannonii TaxID=406548 RepID=A0A5B9VTW8_9BACT|nr:sigma-70 family RNA polymerase sigma factor [Aquisphaera giovannonii]QEH31564.1 ECF RNA polymerase sigma factor SigE [Aquisphaera giovannonii]